MPQARGSPALPGLRARIPSMRRSAVKCVWPPMTMSAPQPASNGRSCSSVMSGSIPGPSSAWGEAWTPRTAGPPGNCRRSWTGSSCRISSRPA